MDDKVIGALIAATSALLTLLVRWGIETLQHRAKRQQDVDYLAVRVVCELERFMAGCHDVVTDTRRDPDSGDWVDPAPAPHFEPDDLKVEWKVVPPELVYQLLNLPGDQAAAELRVEWLYNQDYSDTEMCVDARRDEYIKLGARAGELTRQLRQLGTVPQPHTDWAEIFSRLRAHLEAREAAHSTS